jgi:hypothetical protein
VCPPTSKGANQTTMPLQGVLACQEASCLGTSAKCNLQNSLVTVVMSTLYGPKGFFAKAATAAKSRATMERILP